MALGVVAGSPSDSSIHVELLRVLREGDDTSDFVIRSGTDTFFCHRNILKDTSKYFSRYFSRHPDERGMRLEGYRAEFESILCSIYSQFFSAINSRNVYLFLYEAERSGIRYILAHCLDFLKANVGMVFINYFQYFKLVYDEENFGLMPMLVNFIVSHFEIIFDVDNSFLDAHVLDVDYLKFLLKFYRSQWIPYENENFLLVALIRWTRFDCFEKRKDIFVNELVDMVDFERVSIECMKFIQARYHILRNVVFNEAYRQSWKKMIVEKIGFARYDYQPASLLPYFQLVESSFHVLVGRRTEPGGDDQRASETYKVFSKFKHTWFSRDVFHKKLRKLEKHTHALLACVALNEPNNLFCVEYDGSEHIWPQFNVYQSLFLSTNARPLKLARVPFPLSRRPSMSGLSNRSDVIYLFGNDEVVESSRWECARFHRRDFDDERAYRQCYFYYLSGRDKWFVVPFRGQVLRGSCLVACDTLAYAIGGYQNAPVGGSLGSDSGRYVQAYEHRSSSWITLPMTTYSYHSSYGRPHYSSGCVLNSEIYVCNGENMEVYNPTAGRWRTVTTEWTSKVRVEPNAWRKLIAYQDDVYLFEQHDPNIFCRIYNPCCRIWSSSTLNMYLIADGSFLGDILLYKR